MQLIDEITIKAKAGHGGDGVVRWRQEKFIPKGGPAGGDGGKGGDVYLRAIRDPFALARYKRAIVHEAGRGDDGGEAKRHGANGKDIILDIPIGSVVTNVENGMKWELTQEGEQVLVLYGGHGGLGNEHFKSSLNTTPLKATPGKSGERAEFFIELSLFADIGFVGLPNAGKSSLLNSLTNAKAKIGEYAFTTLDPNLGDFHGYILADIPGLIEGASEGKGLGTKFLRHITHTRILAHLVSCELGVNKILTKKGETSKKSASSDGMMKAYKDIRAELESYGHGLAEKDEVIVLTKTDVFSDSKELEARIKEFKKLKKPVFTISLFDEKSVKMLADEIIKLLKKK